MLGQNMNWDSLIQISTSKAANSLEEKLDWNQESFFIIRELSLNIGDSLNNNNVVLLLKLV
jgi:hypothetical protein